MELPSNAPQPSKEFMSDLRHRFLPKRPDLETKTKPELSTAETVFSIFERFHHLCELKTRQPDLNFEGKDYSEEFKKTGKELALGIDGQVILSISKDGNIGIKSDKYEGKDIFMPGKEFALTLDIKTQTFTPPISPEVQGLLGTMLDTIDGYYSLYEQAAVLAGNYHQTTGKKTLSPYPGFPSYAVKELVYRMIDAQSSISLDKELLSSGIPIDILRQVLKAVIDLKGQPIGNLIREHNVTRHFEGLASKEYINLHLKYGIDKESEKYFVHREAKVNATLPFTDPSEFVRMDAASYTYIFPKGLVSEGFNAVIIVTNHHDNRNKHRNNTGLQVMQVDPDKVQKFYGDVSLFDIVKKHKMRFEGTKIDVYIEEAEGEISILPDGKVQSSSGYGPKFRNFFPIDANKGDDVSDLLQLLKTVIDPFEEKISTDFKREEKTQRQAVERRRLPKTSG